MPIKDLVGPNGPNQYQNLEPFDRGGMGEVYTALDTSSNGKVAIKIISVPSNEYADLLARELEVSQKVIGDHIAKTLFVGKNSFGSQQYLYLVQRFYGAGNMRKIIRKGIGLDECFRMMNDLLDGLGIAHKLVIHRDLKPENILVDDAGNLLLTDFGLAKYVEDATKSKTFKGSGTYPYMSPECWTNQTNSPAMDIYSLGIIFFEILAGELPAKCTSPDDWRDFHLFTSLPDIDSFRNDVPVKLKQILLKMTEKRVQERFKSVDEVKAAIRQAEVQVREERSEIERLAQLAHTTVTQTTTEVLRQKKLAEKETLYQKLLNFHVTELFNRIKRIIVEVNQKLEGYKIIISETPFNGNINTRKMEVSFQSKKFYISFSASRIFEEYEDYYIKNALNAQKQHYEFVVDNVKPSIFKQKNIILLGKLHCNHLNPSINECYGFNLVLVKTETEQYGRWFIASFSDSGISQRPIRSNFSLNENDFLREFELCFCIYTMSVNFRELNDDDLMRALQEILSA